MKVLVVYCHPSKNSFTHTIKESFIRGLEDAG
ncbi:MAG: NAD(P)H-dependent oxidoreductase, partial [Lachnospiraceae bacterium]|nr:NAD(P)H-dependent oxidoreductase [Lachnospiraceae bacterium]